MIERYVISRFADFIYGSWFVNSDNVEEAFELSGLEGERFHIELGWPDVKLELFGFFKWKRAHFFKRSPCFPSFCSV